PRACLVTPTSSPCCMKLSNANASWPRENDFVDEFTTLGELAHPSSNCRKNRPHDNSPALRIPRPPNSDTMPATRLGKGDFIMRQVSKMILALLLVLAFQAYGQNI